MTGIEVLSPVEGRVQSARHEEVWYAVSLEEPHCTCPGFLYRGRCRHLRQFAEEVGAAVPAEVPRSVPEPVQMQIGEPVPIPDGFAIFTSRYQAKDKILTSGCTPVGVTVGNPRFSLPYRYRMAKEIAPSGLMGIEDTTEFTRRYISMLDRVGVDKIREKLMDLGGGGPVVLLCFEDTAKDFCHRTVFAKWWKAKTGEDVVEL